MSYISKQGDYVLLLSCVHHKVYQKRFKLKKNCAALYFTLHVVTSMLPDNNDIISIV
jgi:hypothetical protein